MKKVIFILLKIIMALIILIVLLMLISFINHKIRLSKEDKILEEAKALRPLGNSVDVGENFMNIYTEGEGDITLVFMSGGGTCSPMLDFKSLYSLLSEDFRIAVVEKLSLNKEPCKCQ